MVALLKTFYTCKFAEQWVIERVQGCQHFHFSLAVVDMRCTLINSIQHLVRLGPPGPLIRVMKIFHSVQRGLPYFLFDAVEPFGSHVYPITSRLIFSFLPPSKYILL